MSTAVPMYGFGGGGGAALNFKVVPGLTQPGTAAENTIWVKAEKINNWYFSATQPEGMQNWDVWFPTSTSSSVKFNALKKNNVTVYPISAKQMVSGSLVNVVAKSYQNGAWVEWIVQFAESAWKKISAFPVDSYEEADFEFSGSYFKGTVNKDWDETSIASVEQYDLTNIDTISAKVTLSKNLEDGANAFIAVSKTQEYYDSSENAKYAVNKEFKTKITSKSQTLDVSKLTGKYYIVMGLHAWYDLGTVSFTVADMKLS